MAVAWFFAVLLPILLCLRVSGAHLNPAVTLGLAVSGRMPRSEAPSYVAAQFAGAFFGSAVVLFSLGDFAHLGATTPSVGNLATVFAGELLFSGALIASVFALADRPEGGVGWRILLPPATVGVSTYVIGPITGSSLNPARTVAPAVLSGTYTDLGVYLLAVPLAAILVALMWRNDVTNLPSNGRRVAADPKGVGPAD
jgi:glycerol uptake facilitator-like aquaporin